MNYKDYPNISTSLLVRLWKYKNRHRIKEPQLTIKEYGIQTILHHTPYGILHITGNAKELRKEG